MSTVPTMWHTLPYHSVLSAVQLRSFSITFTDNMAANDNPNGTYATAEDSVATSARNQTRGIVPEEHLHNQITDRSGEDERIPTSPPQV